MVFDIPEVEGLNTLEVLTLVYCRSYAQYLSMLKHYRERTCPFCDPLDPVKNPVIQERGGWRLWRNPFGIKHTRIHLVMAPHRHVAPGEPIAPEDFTAMGELFLWAQQEFKFTGGGFAMRFGSPIESSGTVLHLHANIIVPDLTGGVDVTLAKTPEKFTEQVARMRVFEKLAQGASFNDLGCEEQHLVEGCL